VGWARSGLQALGSSGTKWDEHLSLLSGLASGSHLAQPTPELLGLL
jgi:hypothetical protein